MTLFSNFIHAERHPEVARASALVVPAFSISCPGLQPGADKCLRVRL